MSRAQGKSTRTLLVSGLLSLYIVSHAAVHTLTLDVDGAINVLADPGFEAQMENTPDSSSHPWFTLSEDGDNNILASADQFVSGERSLVFSDYSQRGELVQNVNLKLDTGKHYHLSFWMRVDEASTNPGHDKIPELEASLYSGTALGGEYHSRVVLLQNATAPAGGGWNKMTASISGADLSAHDGEYIQLRISKVNENTSHKIFIDNVCLAESNSADAPQPVSRYMVGGNLVYSHEPESTWEDGTKVELMKHLGMSNLRYPEGGQTRFWDWEFPYHDHPYRNFWDPAYEATLTEQRKEELREENGDRLSLDRFLEICEETGAVPLIGINMTQGWKYDRLQDSIDKAVRLVNYVKNKIDGPRYYFLGNEAGNKPNEATHVPEEVYPTLIDDYAIPIKEADPLGKTIVNMMQWERMEEIIRDQGQHVDMIDWHWYYYNGNWGAFRPEQWRDEDFTTNRWNNILAKLEDFEQWKEDYNQPHIKLGFNEWNLGRIDAESWGGTPGTVYWHGLVNADMLILAMENEIHMGSLWPMYWNTDAPAKFRNLYDPSGNYLSPAFHVQRAFSKAAGGTILNFAGSIPSRLRTLAVKSADDAFIDIYLLNKDTSSMDLAIELPVPVVEMTIMTYAQGATAEEVEVDHEQFASTSSLLELTLRDTSFTYVRCRLPDNSASFEIICEDMDDAITADNLTAGPYPSNTWHQQGTAAWSTENDNASVSVGDFDDFDGNELRIGWGSDEVVVLYSTNLSIQVTQDYTLRGKWMIHSVEDAHNGFIAGLAEYSSVDGSLVQRLTDDTNVFGNTLEPSAGERGLFELTLTAEELALKGPAPGNRIGFFIHRNNGDALYDGSTSAASDTYFIDNVFLDTRGSISMLDQWMASKNVTNALYDSDGDGIDNRTEYYYGGDPTLDDASIIAPTFTMVHDAGTDWMEVVYRMRSNPLLGLSYTLETTSSLMANDWNSVGSTHEGAEVINSEVNAITNRVSIQAQPELFLRLRVMEN
ncbi:MAG: hypothetical protein AB3N63_06335 [Puniceicoccaceae bacterium]